MPRYYIHISDNGRMSIDEEGSHLTSGEDARKEAIGVLPDIARDNLPDGDHHTFEAVVCDEDGQAIFHATLSLHCAWLPPHHADRA